MHSIDYAIWVHTMKKLILLTAILFSQLTFAGKPVVTMQEAKEFCAVRYSQRDNPQGFNHCVQIVHKYGFVIK